MQNFISIRAEQIGFLNDVDDVIGRGHFNFSLYLFICVLTLVIRFGKIILYEFFGLISAKIVCDHNRVGLCIIGSTRL